jgi:hypothetical protein
MQSRNWLVLFALVPAVALAWGDDCKVRAERNAGIDVAGVEKVVLRTGAGDLKVRGSATATRIEAKGQACAAKQELLDASQVNVRREGKVVFVETALPQDKSGWSWGNNDYAYIDLDLSLPSGLPVEAIDSSGDAELSGLKSLEMQDSSGDLDIEAIAGAVEVNDSSGDLEIERVGSVRVRDSSGDIEISEVSKDATVLVDSSGDMRISRVQGNVEVQQDSSGGIRIEEVKGSVKIDSDSSGDIYAGGVGGDFTVSEDSSGSIGHGTIAGKITVPSNHRDDVE